MRGALACALACAASLLAGCGHTEAHFASFQGPGAPARPAAASTELHIGTAPSRPYRELGLVQAISYGEDERAALGALRREGRRRGCDAVVKARVDQGVSGAHAIGVCVAWTE